MDNNPTDPNAVPGGAPAGDQPMTPPAPAADPGMGGGMPPAADPNAVPGGAPATPEPTTGGGDPNAGGGMPPAGGAV